MDREFHFFELFISRVAYSTSNSNVRIKSLLFAFIHFFQFKFFVSTNYFVFRHGIIRRSDMLSDPESGYGSTGMLITRPSFDNVVVTYSIFFALILIFVYWKPWHRHYWSVDTSSAEDTRKPCDPVPFCSP
jgi:hypothetical protein